MAAVQAEGELSLKKCDWAGVWGFCELLSLFLSCRQHQVDEKASSKSAMRVCVCVSFCLLPLIKGLEDLTQRRNEASGQSDQINMSS